MFGCFRFEQLDEHKRAFIHEMALHVFVGGVEPYTSQLMEDTPEIISSPRLGEVMPGEIPVIGKIG